MDKKRLFSIGKLSKLTGVHIQSLRYYETLGILKPIYVDPDSQYRYYSFSQIRIVEAIQYCVELDIPLKKFQNFLSEKNGQIDYSGLLKHGEQIAQKKMLRIQERLDFVRDMQREIHHAEICRTQPITKATFPEKLCWTIPYEGTQSESAFHTAMYRMISEIQRNGLHAGFCNGQLLYYTEQRISSYLFIDLRETGDILEQYPQIMQIPGGEYLCSTSKESCIENASEIFPELFQQEHNRVVIEEELFTGQFNYSTPIFELRCST